jgi:hypothetical protein
MCARPPRGTPEAGGACLATSSCRVCRPLPDSMVRMTLTKPFFSRLTTSAELRGTATQSDADFVIGSETTMTT